MTAFKQDLLFKWKQHQANNLVHNRRYNWNISHQRLRLYYCTGVWTGAKPLQFREDQHNLYQLLVKKMCQWLSEQSSQCGDITNVTMVSDLYYRHIIG